MTFYPSRTVEFFYFHWWWMFSDGECFFLDFSIHAFDASIYSRGFRERNYNSIEIRATTKFNCVHGYVALAARKLSSKIETGQKRRSVWRRKETKYQNVFTEYVSKHPRKYNRVSSNVFKFTVAREAHAHQKLLSPPFFLSLSIFIFPNIHAEISLRILLNISTNCAHQGCQFDAKSKIPSEGLIMIIALRGKIGDAKIQKHPSLPF